MINLSDLKSWGSGTYISDKVKLCYFIKNWIKHVCFEDENEIKDLYSRVDKLEKQISKEELDPYTSKWLHWISVEFLKPPLWLRVLCFERWCQYVARLEEWWWYKGNVYVEYPTHWIPLPNNP